MEKRIELEKRGRPANQITELNLDNCRSTNIVGLTDEFTALESLSLINVGLTTLKGFPKLPNLKKLELSDNRISNGLSNLLASTKLTNLNLSGNKIKDLEELKALENFKHLQVLDLFNNEATSIDSYRPKIFGMIPSLVYLDGFDAYDVEAISEGEDDDELNGNESDEDGNEDSDVGEENEEDGDEEYDEEDEELDEDNGDVSLAEVYNDDLEEDNSDYVEEVEGEEDESDEDEFDDEAAGTEKAKGQPEPAEEESPARGKKRKHEDNDG